MDTNLHESTLLDQQDISTEVPKQQVVYLDETKKYVKPIFTGDYVDVELKRKFYAGENNSLCLPFSLSAEQIKQVWGVGTEVSVITGSSETKFYLSTCDDIVAGKPCFLNPKKVNAKHIYQFNNIDISTWKNNNVLEYIAGTVRVIGFFSPTMIKKGLYVLGEANKMYHLDIDMNANGYRCYVEDISIDDNTIIMNDVKSLTIPEGNVTKIEDSEGKVIWSALQDSNT